jgi:hypothetical protein
MHDFVGLDLLLPEADLTQAVVTKVWRPGPTGRPVMEKLPSPTLYDALIDERLLVGPKERAASQRDRTPALVG